MTARTQYRGLLSGALELTTMIRLLVGCFLVAAILAPAIAHPQNLAASTERASVSSSNGNETSEANPMTITADLTDAPRQLLHAEIEIPVKPGPFTFTAAQWIPGAHSPVGQIGAFAGIVVTANGQPIRWRRDDVDMYAFHVVVPNGVTRLHIHDDFLAVRSGFDVGPNLAELEWDRLMLYPAGVPVNEITVVPSVIIPSGWKLGTALAATKSTGNTTRFAPTTIRHLEDSPILTGLYFKEIPLALGLKPQHFLDVAADSPQELDQNLSPAFLAALNKLVPEAWEMYGSHHYDSYHFLLTLSDFAGRHGQEHQESSHNGVSPNGYSDPAQALLNGELLPHEFSHSWNGKYRRPIGLNTPDFATPMKDELLWVYEGLTRLLGDVLAVRSGFETPEQFREALAYSAAFLDEKPGRTWRNVEDSAVSAPVQDGSMAYNNWRRSFDFYGEGELLWLDTDMLIRKLTNGKKSLHDFFIIFLAKDGNTGPLTVPYDFDELVSDLNQVAPYDWAHFLREQITSLSPHADLAGITQSGWKLAYRDEASSYEKADMGKTLDAYFSLGLLIREDGTIGDVRFFSPAFEAKLSPGAKILKINGRDFSPAALHQALTERDSHSPLPDAEKAISMTIRLGGVEQNVSVSYHGGERFPVLERNPNAPDLLRELLAPLTK
jgi:predicted metalloprotease with PDZ domain